MSKRKRPIGLNGKSNLQRLKDNELFLRYYNQLLDIAIGCFKWENVPDTIDTRYLEKCLFNFGSALYFKDELMGDLTLLYTGTYPVDVYGIPIKRQAYADNGYTNMLDNTNSVIIWNNLLHTNEIYCIEYFAMRLYELDMTMRINEKAQRTPIHIQCDQDTKLTLENIYQQYEGGEPVIVTNKGIGTNPLTVLETKAPVVFKDLFEQKMNIWNECMAWLGIQNTSMEKRSRLNTEEVQTSQGTTLASRQSRLKARQQACDQINKMFGTDITVSFVDTQLDTLIKQAIAEEYGTENEDEVETFKQATKDSSYDN